MRFCLNTHTLRLHFRCILTLHFTLKRSKMTIGDSTVSRDGAVVRTFASHRCKLLLLLLGSISAVSLGPFLPERGIISRTAAGNRAYSVARLLSVVLSNTSNMALNEAYFTTDTNHVTSLGASSRASIPKHCAVTKQLFSFCSKL